MGKKLPTGVGIIRYRGEVQIAQFMGETIERVEKLFIPEFKTFVPCTPYDDHFVYEVPRVSYERAAAMLKSLKAENLIATREYRTLLMGAIQAVDDNQKVQIPSVSYMCTCGSAAVFYPPRPPTAMVVCHLHLTTGFHQTSLVNKKDFDMIAKSGQMVKPKGKKWLI